MDESKTVLALADRLTLGAAPWPLLSYADPRYARLFPRRSVTALAYLGAYTALVVAAALVEPWALVAIGALAAVGTVRLLVLASPRRGRARRLPPGSLHLLPVRPVTDHDYVAKRIARYGPVSKAAMTQVAHPVVLVHGLGRGAGVLRANDAGIEWVGMSFDDLIPTRFIRSMNAEDHAHYIRLLRESFADRVVAACRESFRPIARAELERLAAGAAPADPRPALARYAVGAMARLILGSEPDAPDRGLVERLYVDPGPMVIDWRDDTGGLAAAADQAQELVRRQGAALLAAGDDAPPSFLGELVRAHPEAIDDVNLRLNLAFMLGTSSRDVTGLLLWVVKKLGGSPEWARRLRDDTADLSTRVVLETLRHEQSEYVLRRVIEPIEIEGYTVPAGWYLRICVRESHRDPAVFADPDVFDPDRFAGTRLTRDQYAPLGMTNRPCIGVATTIAAVSVFAEELCRGWDWSLARDGRVEYDGFHWCPSRRLRVDLTRVARPATVPAWAAAPRRDAVPADA